MFELAEVLWVSSNTTTLHDPQPLSGPLFAVLVYPTTSKYFHQSSYYGPQIVQSAFDDDQGGLALFMLCGGIGLSTPSLHGKNTQWIW